MNYEFPNHGFVRLPRITITADELTEIGLSDDSTNTQFLRQLVQNGLEKKNITRNDKYQKQVERELDMFEKFALIDYILLVWRVINFCNQRQIETSLGRGSASGSLVFYAIGVTGLDPIKYDLFFERFISEARANCKEINGEIYIDGSLAPDVDIDVEQARRHEVIQYLHQLFPKRVCKIANFSTLQSKALIKECGKIVGGFEEDELKMVTNLIPVKYGKVMEIEEAYDTVLPFKNWCDNNLQVYRVACKLRGLIKNKSSHASGYVISYNELDTYMPLEYQNHEICSALDKKDVEQMAIKLDILGLRTCSVVAEAFRDLGFTKEDINVHDDPKIYEHFQNIKYNEGLFQISESATFGCCQQIAPKNLEQLSDVVAISRPGAMDYLEHYVHDTMPKIHNQIDIMLESTRGVMLYQEQVMKIASEVFGFSLVESEQLRRIIGKKKVAEIATWKSRIYDNAEQKGLDKKIADAFWKVCEDSANYSFNKSHSVAYAAYAALTVYLKFNHPLEFFKALLNNAKHQQKPIEEIAKIYPELHHFGIELLPPDLHKSAETFTIEGDNIRYGYSLIKSISAKSLDSVAKMKGEYRSKFEIFEAFKDHGVKINIFCALCHIGYFDCLGLDTRSHLALEAQLWNVLTAREKNLVVRFGEQYHYNLLQIVKYLKSATDCTGKPYIKESRFETIRKKYAPYKAIYDANHANERLTNFYYEFTSLGYSPSENLYSIYSPKRGQLIPIENLAELADHTEVHIIGIITEKPREAKAKKSGKKYARFMLTDHTAHLIVLTFDTHLDTVKAINGGQLPQENAIVYVKGRTKGDVVFAEILREQTAKIYTKYIQLKKDE